MKRKINKTAGFTLVELLTTLAVVAILLGLLIPALNQVSKTATRVRQKAQFHAIGMALEAFRIDDGDYPPSKWDPTPADPTDGYDYGYYSASQRLAEALVGRDGFGFHPASRFHEDGWDASGNGLYAPDIDPQTNLAARKGPYLELESANAVKLGDIYPDDIMAAIPLGDTFVLADMYKQVKNRTTGKQTGMPILYYRANKLQTGHAAIDFVGSGWGWPNNTYNLGDSFCNKFGLIQIPAPWDLTQMHFNRNVERNADIFYDAIKNPNFTNPPRPYRSESFILHSAGPDGLYGTTDDIFNFDTEN